MGGFSEIVIPTPQFTRNLAVINSGYAPVRPIVALRHGKHGTLKIPGESLNALPAKKCHNQHPLENIRRFPGFWQDRSPSGGAQSPF